ncbi:LOW QUALITY PROTEIN: Integrase, catalytic core protein [Phytophthora megakarya]|uniref:Integrase, catalytic core protein n=1 Tax=Phytophthora megakarya TaxID=4795 RepID=A0A225VJI2_9STRA|nr:LOW QUALITY PROTEIN: Integrase, catalytic core protein [Phytophthora megakarya]
MSRRDAAELRKAISAEGKALRANTYALSCRWIFKVTYNSDGSFERYKARLVVIGCQQIKYVDFDDVFAPVVRLEYLRVLLAIVCIKKLECDQIDIETAFLNGLQLEDVYMKQPEGMINAGTEGLLVLTETSSEGLAQRADRTPGKKYLIGCNSCVYLHITKEGRQIVAIYIDDLLIIAKTKKEIGAVKVSYHNAFKAKDL